jgi:hypothetical protein
MAESVTKTNSRTSQQEKSDSTADAGSATTPTTSTEATEPSEGELREAKQYWGELFAQNKHCSETLNRLLTAIAKYIVIVSCI